MPSAKSKYRSPYMPAGEILELLLEEAFRVDRASGERKPYFRPISRARLTLVVITESNLCSSENTDIGEGICDFACLDRTTIY